jgi:hypothetical protein
MKRFRPLMPVLVEPKPQEALRILPPAPVLA